MELTIVHPDERVSSQYPSKPYEGHPHTQEQEEHLQKVYYCDFLNLASIT